MMRPKRCTTGWGLRLTLRVQMMNSEQCGVTAHEKIYVYATSVSEAAVPANATANASKLKVDVSSRQVRGMRGGSWCDDRVCGN